MTGQVPSKVKKIRSAEIRNLFSGSAKNYRELFVGRELNVLWERSIKENGAWKVSGLSDNYIRVEARSVQNQYNQVTKARIIGLNDQGLLADDLYK